MSSCAILQDCKGPYYACNSCNNGVCRECIFELIKNKICDCKTTIYQVPCPYCRTVIDIAQCDQKFGNDLSNKLLLQSTIHKFCNGADYEYTLAEVSCMSTRIIQQVYDCGVSFEISHKKIVNLAHLKALVNNLTTIYCEITKSIN
jgi:hypothetical protein